MRSQIIILVFGCLLLTLFGGCETTRGVKEGIWRDLKNTKCNRKYSQDGSVV